jgi:hypothetical protein
MQADDCNADYIVWIKMYEKVIERMHIEGLKQAGIQAIFITSAAVTDVFT